MADNIKFSRGEKKNLENIEKIAGQVLFSIDDNNQGEIYLDKNNSRIKMATSAIATQNEAGLIKSGGDITVGTNGIISINNKGVASGLATLGADGKIPAGQLPNYIDDIITVNQYNDLTSTLGAENEDAIFYVSDYNKFYKWENNSGFKEVSPHLQLGEISTTAYYGDKGKIAYDHATTKGKAYSSGLYKITTNNEGHITNATIVNKTDIINLGIPSENTDTWQANSRTMDGYITKGSSGISQFWGTDNSGNPGWKKISKDNLSDDLQTEIDGKASIASTNALGTYKVDKVEGKGLSTNDYTTAEKNKLAGISTGAEVNQNAFSKIIVGSNTIEADTKQDTLTLKAGNNIALSVSTSDDTVTINATNTTYNVFNNTTAGLVPSGDNNGNTYFLNANGKWTQPTGTYTYTLPTATSSVLGGVKVDSTISSTNGYTAVVRTTDGKIYYKDTNTTYTNATTSSAGLMSASDKSKLDGITSGANNYSLPTATSSTLGGVKIGSNISVSSGTISLNKSNVTSALGYTPPTTNTTYSNATTSSAGLMSASDKSKLDNLSTYSVFSSGTNGLVPATSSSTASSDYVLGGGGSWIRPINTTLSSANANYPLLFTYNSGMTSDARTSGVHFNANMYVNPSTGTITSNVISTKVITGDAIRYNSSTPTGSHIGQIWLKPL